LNEPGGMNERHEATNRAKPAACDNQLHELFTYYIELTKLLGYSTSSLSHGTSYLHCYPTSFLSEPYFISEKKYAGVSKSFRTESTKKYMLTTIKAL